MRSKRRTAGIALAACVVLALVLATWATGASQSSAQAPVGSGKASAKKSTCGKGTGKKATGRPIKLGGINMSLVSACCETTAVLDFGKLIASGPTREVLQNEHVINAYLGTEEEV